MPLAVEHENGVYLNRESKPYVIFKFVQKMKIIRYYKGFHERLRIKDKVDTK
jgi:hypothetical protein